MLSVNKKDEMLLLSKRIAIYLRVSTDEQAEKNISIPAQESRIRSYCKSKGWTVISEPYIDNGYSGKNLERPAIQQLIKDCKEDKFDAVAVWKLDRLSRRQRDAIHIIEDVFGLNPESKNIERKIDLISVTESIDTSTPMGRAQLGIMFIFSQLERETIIERSRFGKKEAAEQGRFGGGLPYGYDYNKEKGQLVVNPVQAEAVKMIFEYYLTGKYGFNTIANIMTEKGFAGQRTSYMQKDQVKNVLASPFVAGYIKHLNKIYHGQHEAIIDKETWDKAQELINKRYTPIPVKDDHNLLTGLIYCGKCGCRMRFKSRIWTSKKSVGNNFYYVCYARAGYKTMSDHYCSSSYFSAEKVNNKVVEKLKCYSINQDELEEFLEKKRNSSAKTKVDIAVIEAELSNIDKMMERWLDAFEKGGIKLDVLNNRMNKLYDRKTKLENSINDFKKQQDEFNADMIRASEVLEAIHYFPQTWDVATIEERRQIIQLVVKKVTVTSNDDITVELDI